ncbi:MAG: ADP-ribosylglycohydrolase family protein [Actinobacteria bacterium]|nr:ADP-ribosylglycohydrolase family protein [Actinomycetota bacterium]
MPGEAAGRRRDRSRGALLGVVVIDAIGSPYEGRPGPVPLELLPNLEAAGPTLRYTDDTALTALSESLLSLGCLDLDHVTAAFALAYEREPNRGYGQAAAQLLSEVASGAAWQTTAAALFGAEGSFGNGAAMRVAPIALHTDGFMEVAARLGRASATVTHSPRGRGRRRRASRRRRTRAR